MRRALALAEAGRGRTGENPVVGCVIVSSAGTVLSEARTGDGGRPHAEETALDAAGDAKGGTAYVTLEPCARRTTGAASCADRLIAAGVRRVVVAARDPHPFASGEGVARLQAAGASVEMGLLQDEARAQNPAFFAQWDREK
ncbi:MAG: riboflavin biosynthesis protein RibD [Alphaproteobacteria bacterium]|nr:riboflavin biosynthesis protein RibD [Alphaproteobacteria bacterium]